MTIPVKTNNKKSIRSFGRVQTRKLSGAKSNLMESLLPAICVKIPKLNPFNCRKINLEKLFDFNTKEVWLEIGFGFGEHLFERAIKNPKVGFIGCETHINGVASLLHKIADYEKKNKTKIKNIRIFNGDARLLLECLKRNSLDKVFILFPDPWPKKKHHKRRIIQLDFLKLLSKKIKKGGILFFASDIEGYISWTLGKIVHSGKFKWTAKSEKDWQQAPKWWIQTRYQAKAIREGRKSAFLEFINQK